MKCGHYTPKIVDLYLLGNDSIVTYTYVSFIINKSQAEFWFNLVKSQNLY